MGKLRTAKSVTVAAGAAVAAGWAAYSRWFVNHRTDLPPSIDTKRGDLDTSSGRLSYYVDRHAGERPLVLLHSINAAASAYEVRPLFERYRAQRTTYAPDLPGFGFSERADRTYTPELYANAILDFLETVVREPADVVALSLSSEFAALAAVSLPELFHTLALISPTGFSRREASRPIEAFFRALSVPLWSQAFYDLLVTDASIRHFLRKSFAGPIDEGLAAYDYATSHQPGSRYAPLQFLSGRLFTPFAIETLYSRVSTPAAILFDRDGYTDFDRIPDFLSGHPHWKAVRIAGTKGLPHFEKPRETSLVLERFWSKRAAA
jgi:pimeloyl-ACP methyl ester carboxylesterase